MPSLRHVAVTIMDGTARGVPTSTLSSMSSFTKAKAFYSTFDYHHGYHNLKWLSARMLAYPAPTNPTNNTNSSLSSSSSSSSSLSSHSSWSDSHCVDETLRRPVTRTMNDATTVAAPQRAITATTLSPTTGGLRWPSHQHHRPIVDRSSSPSSIPSPRNRLISSPSILSLSTVTSLSWSTNPTTTITTTSTSSSQKRSHVWHAGFLDEERAQDLDDTIRHKQRELVRLIRHLPDAVHDRISCNGGGRRGLGVETSFSTSPRRTNSTATATATVVTSTSDWNNNNNDMEDRTGTWRQPSVSLALIETILRTEQDILTLCQEYKMLTGEEYSRLPEPGTDDSSTVRRMV